MNSHPGAVLYRYRRQEDRFLDDLDARGVANEIGLPKPISQDPETGTRRWDFPGESSGNPSISICDNCSR